MDNIALHIEYLLRHHDCVIVPGLGAFVAVSTPASFDIESGLMLPPVRSIMFNAAISSDDGLLANSYARRRGIKYEAARTALSSDVERLRASIEARGSVAVGRIGSLCSSGEGKISFRPALSGAEMMLEMGCAPISLRKQPQTPVKETETPAKRFSDDYYYIPVHKTFAKAAASIVAVIAVALAFLVSPYASHRDQVEASVLPLEKILRLHSDHKDDRLKTEHQIKATSAAVADIASSNAEETAVVTEDCNSEAESVYYLIVATFHDADDAAQYIAASGDDVRSSLRVISHGATHRVALASSADRSEMLQKLNDGAISNRFQGAWIWEEKKF